MLLRLITIDDDFSNGDSSSQSDLVSPSEESDNNEEEKKHETAMFVPEEGLVGTTFNDNDDDVFCNCFYC